MDELMVERPGDQMMADKLEDFFPGITQRVSNSHLAEIKPIIEDDGLMNNIQASITHKRQSRMSMKTNVMARRSTLKMNIGSPFTRSTNTSIRPGRISESSRIVEEAGRASIAVDAATPETPSAQSTPDTLTTPANSRPPSVIPAESTSPARPRVGRRTSSAMSTPAVATPATLFVGMSPNTQELQPISRWEQGRMIGQGAFGRVYHGINLDTGEFLAVKQVAISVADSFGVQDASKKKRSDALAMEVELLKEVCACVLNG
jgi:hypothetical protein